MACHTLQLPGRQRAIVCDRAKPKRCQCGGPADFLCDWKLPTKKGGTCDKPICGRCTTRPTPDKDVCPEHAPALAEWQRGAP